MTFEGRNLDNSRRNRTSTVASPLMTLHVTAHRESLPATSVSAPERLLTRVAVGVDAQTGGPRERLVAGAADVAVMVLLVGGGVGGREVVVVLPGGGDGGDHLLRVRCCRCMCRCGSCGGGSGRSSNSSRSRRSLVVDSGGGGRSGGSSRRNGRLNGRRLRRIRSHTGGGRGIRARNGLDGALAGDGRALRGAGERRHMVVVALVAGSRDGGGGGRVAAGPVEAGTGAQRWRGRQADGNAGHGGVIGARLRTRVRRADSLAFCYD